MFKKAASNDDIAVRVNNVYKDFYLPHEKSNSLKSQIVHMFRKKDKGADTQHALRGISFDVKKGDFFGIVGRNGCGKSTLLKIISEIYQPTKGSVSVSGKLVPFIELGVGFNPELTGRENVYLNGALLGFSQKEMEEKYDDIVSFAELEDFMDQKLKNYSSGMQVRLAFSVAIQADADILLLDEVLAVGDEAFQRKCNEFFTNIKRDRNKTIILVTHSMDSVRKYCNKAMFLNEGKIEQVGSPDKIANAYSDLFIQEQVTKLEQKDEEKIANNQLSDIYLNKISFIQGSKKVRVVEFRKDFSLKIAIDTNKKYNHLTMGIHFIDQSGRDVVALTTDTFGGLSLKKGKNYVEFKVQNIFSDGNYYINLAIEDKNTKKLLLQLHEVAPFTVVGLNLSNYSKYCIAYPDIEMVVNGK